MKKIIFETPLVSVIAAGAALELGKFIADNFIDSIREVGQTIKNKIVSKRKSKIELVEK